MASFKVEHQDCGCCPGGTTTGVLYGEAEEYRTIWFALREYADNLEKSISKWREGKYDGTPQEETRYEDLMFLHSTLGKVYEMMFNIKDNHPPEEAPVVYEFLSV